MKISKENQKYLSIFLAISLFANYATVFLPKQSSNPLIDNILGSVRKSSFIEADAYGSTAPYGVDEYATTISPNPIIYDVLANEASLQYPVLHICTTPALPTLANGTAVIIPASPLHPLDRIKYTPNTSFVGIEDPIWYKICIPDYITPSNPDSAAGTAAFHVTVVPNQPPILTNFPLTIPANTPHAFTNIDFPQHFFDPEGDQMCELKITSLPAHGTLKYNTLPVAINDIITSATVNSLLYTPATGYNGSDTFNWNAADCSFNYATTDKQVNLTIGSAPVVTNNNPVANPDTVSLPQGGNNTVNVLTNDTDPDTGNILSVASFTQPTHGTVTDSGAGVLKYTSTDLPFIGTDTFTYTISDGAGGTATATVTVTITEIENIKIDVYKDRTNENTAVNQEVVIQADIKNPNTNSFITSSEATFEVDASKLEIIPNSAQIGVITGTKYTKIFEPISVQAAPSVTFSYLSATKLKANIGFLNQNETLSITFKVKPLTTGLGNITGIAAIPRLNKSSQDSVNLDLNPIPFIPVLVRTGGEILKFSGYIFTAIILIAGGAIAFTRSKKTKVTVQDLDKK
jgi:Bacterial Ig domain